MTSLAGRYRYWMLGLLCAAPYVVMFAWCWQASNARSICALALTAMLLSLLLAGITRTWRRFFLAYFPLLVLSIAYAAYTLSFGIVPGHTLSIIVLSASLEEVVGLFTVWPQKWLLAPLFAVLGTYLWFAWKLPTQQIFVGKTNLVARVLLGLSVPLLLFAAQKPPQLVDGIALNPAVGSVMFLAGQLPRASRELHGADVHKTPFHASRAATAEEVHIFIVGESARRASWSVYGYSRPTTPYLEKIRPELVLLQHAEADANLTSIAVPVLLTGLNPEVITTATPQGTLLDLAKEAGYSTAWLVNQDMDVSTALGVTADRLTFPPDPKTSLFGRGVLDGELLPAYQHELDRRGGPRFIGMHVMGSHWEYYRRYPPAFQHFGDASKLNSVSMFFEGGTILPDLTDSYDNSVLYTDWFMEQVIEAARKLSVPVTITFVPDHGESLPALDNHAAGHGGPVYFASQFEIPAFVWTNAAFRVAHPEEFAALQANGSKLIRSHDFFFAVAQLMGISWPGAKPERSFASSGFVPDTTSKHVLGGVVTATPPTAAASPEG